MLGCIRSPPITAIDIAPLRRVSQNTSYLIYVNMLVHVTGLYKNVNYT